jgi:hypothetical protein
VAVARYLLTVKLNDYDRDAAGAAFFELGLVPDFELLTDMARASLQVNRNLETVRTLTWSGKSERGRVVELGLSERAFRTQLANFLADIGLEEPRVWTRCIATERENWKFSFHRWKFDEDEVRPDAASLRSWKPRCRKLATMKTTRSSAGSLANNIFRLARKG